MEEFSAQEICANFSPQAIDADGIGNVLIRDKFSGMDFWVNVWTKCGEVMYEWNQYIFFVNDVEDMLRKEIQADNDVAEQAMTCSFDYLLKKRCLYQSENGNWYEDFEYWRNPTPAEIKAGQGAIHYLTLACSECLNKKGQPKKRLVYFRDRLIYYKK